MTTTTEINEADVIIDYLKANLKATNWGWCSGASNRISHRAINYPADSSAYAFPSISKHIILGYFNLNVNIHIVINAGKFLCAHCYANEILIGESFVEIYHREDFVEFIQREIYVMTSEIATIFDLIKTNPFITKISGPLIGAGQLNIKRLMKDCLPLVSSLDSEFRPIESCCQISKKQLLQLKVSDVATPVYNGHALTDFGLRTIVVASSINESWQNPRKWF